MLNFVYLPISLYLLHNMSLYEAAKCPEQSTFPCLSLHFHSHILYSNLNLARHEPPTTRNQLENLLAQCLVSYFVLINYIDARFVNLYSKIQSSTFLGKCPFINHNHTTSMKVLRCTCLLIHPRTSSRSAFVIALKGEVRPNVQPCLGC